MNLFTFAKNGAYPHSLCHANLTGYYLGLRCQFEAERRTGEQRGNDSSYVRGHDGASSEWIRQLVRSGLSTRKRVKTNSDQLCFLISLGGLPQSEG